MCTAPIFGWLPIVFALDIDRITGRDLEPGQAAGRAARPCGFLCTRFFVGIGGPVTARRATSSLIFIPSKQRALLACFTPRSRWSGVGLRVWRKDCDLLGWRGLLIWSFRRVVARAFCFFMREPRATLSRAIASARTLRDYKILFRIRFYVLNYSGDDGNTFAIGAFRLDGRLHFKIGRSSLRPAKTC